MKFTDYLLIGMVTLLVALFARDAWHASRKPSVHRQTCERMLAAARTSTDTVLVLGTDPSHTFNTCAEYLP